MSPEQCRGARLMDHRSDLYSLGVVLYEALTGKVPHLADSFNALMFKIALEDVPDPRTHRPDLDEGLCAVIMKALARDAEKRFQSALEFRSALIEWADENGLDPGSWSVGSVRNIVAATKSGASPKVSAVPTVPTDREEREEREGEDAKDTRMLTDSGERRQAIDAKAARELTDSHDRKKDAEAAPAKSSAVPSQNRPTEPSAERTSQPSRRPIFIGVAVFAAVAILGFALTRRSEPPPTEKTGVGMSASAPTTATATATTTTTPIATQAAATATATESATPPASATAAAPTATGTATATQAATNRPITTGVAVNATASARATASAPAPAASASAKATVEGRTIHTNF